METAEMVMLARSEAHPGQNRATLYDSTPPSTSPRLASGGFEARELALGRASLSAATPPGTLPEPPGPKLDFLLLSALTDTAHT